MRAPYVCRPCLAQLRQLPTPSPRIVRTASHVAALQEPEHHSISEWRNHKDGSVVAGQNLSENSWAGEITEEPLGSQRDQWRNKHSNRTGDSRNRWNLSSPAKLRGSVLRPDWNFTMARRRMAAVYGLPENTARETAAQLQRLLSSHPSNKAELFDEFHAWKMEYGNILRQLSNNGINTTSSHLADWAVFADGTYPSVAEMKASWMELEPAKREKLWPRMIQSMFPSKIELLSRFLQATYESTWSPFYVVEDLVRLLLLRAKLSESGDLYGVRDIVFFLLEADTSSRLQFGQDVIGTVISKAHTTQAHDLFHKMKAAGKYMTNQTLLHFANKFARRSEDKLLAAEILCSMAGQTGFDINSPAASSVCTSILHLEDSSDVQNGHGAPDELFRMLLEAGLRPNLLNITALMRNFCVRGHLETAWTVFDLLLEYGIEPDEHVYSTLLHASKQELNTDSLQRIMASIHSHDTWNATILNDFLDVIFKTCENSNENRRRQKKSNDAFRPMLHVYSKFFHMEPLQRLCSFPLDDYLFWKGKSPTMTTTVINIARALLPQPESKLIKPDTITLSLMLSAMMRGVPRFYRSQQNGVRAILREIDHFKNLFDSGERTAVAIVERHGTLIFDVFLRTMLQFEQLLHPAVQLVKSMLDRSTNALQERGKNIGYPRPSVHTWTMLVNGFKNHRQPGIAASMVRMMIKEGGVRPNMVTWNTLIAAFARVDDAHGAVRTIQYLEQSGLRPDRYTIEAISSMKPHARKQALKLMESSKDSLIPPDDDVAPLLAAPRPAHADYPDPVQQQVQNNDAPPLSDEEMWIEMQQLVVEGDALLSQDIETFAEEDFPAPANEMSESLGASHPRNNSQILRLLEYKKEVEAFITRLQAREGQSFSTRPLIESDEPIARPIKPPTQVAHVHRVKQIWTEAYQARNQLRELDHEQRPVGLRKWEESQQWRLQARAGNFKDDPIDVAKSLDGVVPLGIVAQREQPPHPRTAESLQLHYISERKRRERVIDK